MSRPPDVVIVGVGYVGLTLAVSLADRGMRVLGYDHNPQTIATLRAGHSHLFEPGLDDVMQRHLGQRLQFDTAFPHDFRGTTIICVSTPVDTDALPDLTHMRAASATVAAHVADASLVMVRSTVPVGTSRAAVLPLLRARHASIALACCPERTIQGQALDELRHLPQVVGGLDAGSEQLAVAFWEGVAQRVITVSSLEAAEMVKLINNCHTDVLYGFGNEVAMMAQQHALDPVELIRAANMDYPRPNLARPGFVAGPCLTKDAYLLLHAMQDHGHTPGLIASARKLNESLPGAVARHLLQTMQQHGIRLEQAKVLVCGFAYKGWPVTDDVRGTPVAPLLDVLRQYPAQLYGHDYLVPHDVIARWGVSPVDDVASGLAGVHAVLFMNEHPDYRALPMVELAGRMQRPAVIYDCWRMFEADAMRSQPDIHYAGIGYG